MLEKIIKDYFSFSRRERVAVLILVFLIIIIVLVPYFIPDHGKELDKVAVKDLRLQTAQLQPVKDTNDFQNNNKETKYSFSHYRESSFKRISSGERTSQKAELFYFDPNELSSEGWKKLGLRDKTISIIHNYISKGGKFKTGEDIKRIYGLGETDANRLIPYVKIAALDVRSKQQYQPVTYSKDRFNYDRPKYKESLPRKLIDVNKTDTADLIALPGIGSKLAERILRFREKLGGFYAVEQVSEVYALPDSTFQKIRSWLTVTSPVIPFININLVEVNELKQHPYIKWNIANAIVSYRKQHGNFQNLEDLRKIDLITDDIYKKIVPYLKTE